jgi:CRP-like cAMP-binding protein
MTPVSVLKRIPLFSTLSEGDGALLAQLLRRQTFRKGEVLFHRGDEGSTLYMIVSGKVKISVSRRAEQMTLTILGQGDFLGEMALLDGQPRSADAIAMEDTYVYGLQRNDFLSFLMSHENAVRAVLSALSLRLRKTDDLLTEMCFLNVPDRLAKKLLELAQTVVPDSRDGDVVLSLSQIELARLVGVSRESVNKSLKLLRQRGILSTSRNTIRIHNVQLLKTRIQS